MQAIIYLHASKESNYNVGQKLGLSDEALKHFCYAAYEVELTLDVNQDTGDAKIVLVDGRKIEE